VFSKLYEVSTHSSMSLATRSNIPTHGKLIKQQLSGINIITLYFVFFESYVISETITTPYDIVNLLKYDLFILCKKDLYIYN